jgi:hypothetical protein
VIAVLRRFVTVTTLVIVVFRLFVQFSALDLAVPSECGGFLGVSSEEIDLRADDRGLPPDCSVAMFVAGHEGGTRGLAATEDHLRLCLCARATIVRIGGRAAAVGQRPSSGPRRSMHVPIRAGLRRPRPDPRRSIHVPVYAGPVPIRAGPRRPIPGSCGGAGRRRSSQGRRT